MICAVESLVRQPIWDVFDFMPFTDPPDDYDPEFANSQPPAVVMERMRLHAEQWEASQRE